MKYILMPMELFESEEYMHLPLSAKMLYAMLLDRHRLSKKNGKTDKNGRVVIYYLRENLADLLGCSLRSVGNYLSLLVKAGLIGLGKAPVGKSRPIYVKKFLIPQEKNCTPDVTDLPTPINNSHNEYNQSNIFSHSQERTEEDALEQIKEKCELDIWYDGTGELLECIIERLFYTDSLNVGGAVLNNRQIRSRLSRLTGDPLIRVIDNMKGKNLKNPQAYLLRAVVNAADDYMAECICDSVP